MKVLALFFVISLACVVHSNPRQLMAIDYNHNGGMVSTEQREEQVDWKGIKDQINSHHNIPLKDWGSGGGDANNQN